MSENTFYTRYRDYLSYSGGLLGAVALVCAVALVVTDWNTAERIVLEQAADQRAFMAQVMPATLYDNDLLQDTVILPNPKAKEAKNQQVKVYLARKNGQVVGAVYEVVAYGYSGAINLIMAVNRDGQIAGVRVVFHKETPGLGDKIEIAKGNWILAFNGLSLGNPDDKGWHVKKDGGQFDQFTGATITPRGIVKAVKEGLELFAAHRTQLLEQPQPSLTAK
ncbi:MAG: electron transport complex subunit RsxG [Beggiatoa sp. IS2]|nr:MAG: electron transport complex subunit RsxG [Beggiatoa sp. IS2]